MLVQHIEANKILDERDREVRKAMLEALPKGIKDEVEALVRKEFLARQDYRTYGWRVTWLRQK